MKRNRTFCIAYMDVNKGHEHDCMGRYFAPCKICIPHIPVGYAGGRATHGAVAEGTYATALMYWVAYFWCEKMQPTPRRL
jgi:hypothetical protein